MGKRIFDVGRLGGSIESALQPALRFLRDARGATAIEYAMIGALVFAVAAGSIKLYGSKVDNVYARLGNTIGQVN